MLFISPEEGIFDMRVIPPVKMLADCKDSFHILTPYSQGCNVLDTPASNIHGFIPRDPVLFHSLSGAILSKGDVPYTGKP
jgi:hypothetical protein